MFVLVLLALTTWNISKSRANRTKPDFIHIMAGTISGYCDFPSDNPIRDLVSGQTVPVELMNLLRVYKYTDEFGSCDGCVRALNFCYRPGPAGSERLFTIDIINRGGNSVESHDVMVHPTTDSADCEHYSLGHFECCIEQVLTEPFSVNRNRHYSITVHGGTTSQLLRHETQTTGGSERDLDGRYISGMVYRPLFFFHIDTKSSKLIYDIV